MTREEELCSRKYTMKSIRTLGGYVRDFKKIIWTQLKINVSFKK